MRVPKTQKMLLSGFFLALAMVMPFLTGQLGQLGSALLPMHIPALLAGFFCGPWWGLAVGAIAPLLRSLTLTMPPIQVAIRMTFELAAYGFFAGFFYQRFHKNLAGIYKSLILAMIGGRIVWGAASFVFYRLTGASFTLQMFLAGGITGAIPGIILQLLLIPAIIAPLESYSLSHPRGRDS